VCTRHQYTSLGSSHLYSPLPAFPLTAGQLSILWSPWATDRAWKTVSTNSLQLSTLMASLQLLTCVLLPVIPDLFNLKFTAKSLVRESKKCEQNAAANKLKCKKAMEVSSTGRHSNRRATRQAEPLADSPLLCCLR
jgi:hypothetical protein